MVEGRLMVARASCAWFRGRGVRATLQTAPLLELSISAVCISRASWLQPGNRQMRSVPRAVATGSNGWLKSQPGRYRSRYWPLWSWGTSQRVKL